MTESTNTELADLIAGYVDAMRPVAAGELVRVLRAEAEALRAAPDTPLDAVLDRLAHRLTNHGA
jgi:hypothetical protein